MSSNAPALLLAAGSVGFGHAVLPDHWVPLAVLGRTRRYPLGRVARLSSLAGVAHVLVSLLLGGVIIVVGLQFRSAVQSAQDTIVGGVLILTGIGFLVAHAAGLTHSHERHDHVHDHAAGHHSHAHHERGSRGRGRLRNVSAVMVPFGAAASPDLTILPVFLAAATSGAATAVGSLLVFAAVTISTIVGLTVVAARGGYRIQGLWLERWGNVITALVLVVIGGLVLGGVI